MEQILAEMTRNDIAAAVGGATVGIIVCLFIIFAFRMHEAGRVRIEHDETESQVGRPL
jgi:ABC-type sulfate transport system permease component